MESFNDLIFFPLDYLADIICPYCLSVLIVYLSLLFSIPLKL